MELPLSMNQKKWAVGCLWMIVAGLALVISIVVSSLVLLTFVH